MELKAKLYLVDEDGNKFMGIGVLWLLEQVRHQNSLRKAAMALASPIPRRSAWCRTSNRALELLCSTDERVARNRDGATLHPASSFLSLYRSFEQQAKEGLQSPYASSSRAECLACWR